MVMCFRLLGENCACSTGVIGKINYWPVTGSVFSI